jgi:prolyl oligopeptidase
MPQLMTPPPYSAVEPVTEIFHGVSVTDPYRWLEDQDSPQTRAWIEEQTLYARSYLENIPGRDRIQKRIREFLAVETYDSLQIAGGRYFFRKRLPDQEQPCIYMRDGADGEDQLLVDPAMRETGKYTAVIPRLVSPNGRLLLYETKEGGEITGSFAILDINSRTSLPDVLPRGYLRGFAFAPDGKSFYYVHEAVDAKRPFYRAAYHHVLGTESREDREIFHAGEDKKVTLCLTTDGERLGLVVHRFFAQRSADFYVMPFEFDGSPEPVLTGINYTLGLLLTPNRILAITDRDAPNLRIVELRHRKDKELEWVDLVPESDTRMSGWLVTKNHILVAYVRQTTTCVSIFDFSAKKLGELPVRTDETVRLLGGSSETDEVLVETEAFTEPTSIFRCSVNTGKRTLWAKRAIAFDSANYGHSQVWFTSKDGTRIPMYLVGNPAALQNGDSPTIMTSYGGYGVSMTPQFSIFVAFLMERGCLFALPNIRGGSEFGVEWHNAAKRRNRQTAYDDFLCAAEWLIKTGRTHPRKLAIFGGSNSGLLVGAAMTQRPDLFHAVVCMVPILDMLRYHLFDNARVGRDEFGTSDDPDDFAALAKYSPYHQVQQGVAYPATMVVSGDADRNCNPLHARKMTARLQAANASEHPIFLDYSKFRGHSPVLPLSERIEALTDRMAFLCDQLQLPV